MKNLLICIIAFLTLCFSQTTFAAEDAKMTLYQKTLSDAKKSIDDAKEIDNNTEFLNVGKSVGDGCYKFGLSFYTNAVGQATMKFSGKQFGLYPFTMVGFNAFIFGYKLDNVFAIRFKAGTWKKLKKTDTTPSGAKWWHFKAAVSPLLFGMSMAEFNLLKNTPVNDPVMSAVRQMAKDSAESKDNRKTLVQASFPIFPPLLTGEVKAGPYFSWGFPFEVGFGEKKVSYNEAKEKGADGQHLKLITESQSSFTKKLTDQGKGVAESYAEIAKKKASEGKFLQIFDSVMEKELSVTISGGPSASVGFFAEAGAKLSIGIYEITLGIRGVLSALSAEAKLVLDFSTFRQYIDLGVTARLTALSGDLYAFAKQGWVCNFGFDWCTSETRAGLGTFPGIELFNKEILIGRLNTNFDPLWINCLGGANPQQCNPNAVLPINPELIAAYDYVNSHGPQTYNPNLGGMGGTAAFQSTGGTSAVSTGGGSH